MVEGGFVTYSNRAKATMIGVPAGLIEAHGAVSEETAREMAAGARRALGVDVAIATTGIAGPDGGTPEKPVGTVWVAVDCDGEVHAVRAVLPGDRSEIRYRAAQLALDRLRCAFEHDQDAVGWTARG